MKSDAFNHKYNPFLISFISFALIACLVLCILFLSVMYEQKQAANKHYCEEKASAILDDFLAQVESLEDFADKLMIDDTYVYSTIFDNKYNEYAMLQDFKQYRSFSFLTENAFLIYQGCDHVFRSTGDTVFNDIFWKSLSTEERNIVDSFFSEPGDRTEIFLLADSIYILIPFRADYGVYSSKAVLGSRVSLTALEKRFLFSCGQINGKVALFKDDVLIFSNTDAETANVWKNSATATSSDGTYTVRYAPESVTLWSLTFFAQTLLVLFVIILIFWLAYLFAQKAFMPLQGIVEKYLPVEMVSESTTSGNVYDAIEGVVSTALQDSLSAAVQVEQKQKMLKQHILRSLLNGAYIRDAQAYLNKLNIHLPGPFYYVISVAFSQKVDAAFLSLVGSEVKKVSAFGENEHICTLDDDKAQQIWIICSIGERDAENELTESIQGVLNSYGYKESVGIGRVYEGIEKLSASWLESMDALTRNNKNQHLEHSAQDLQWISEALSLGNEAIALNNLEEYVSWIKENNKSMLMQLYVFSEFIGEIGRLSRANGITLSSNTISLILSSRSIDSFHEAAKEVIIEYCYKYNELLKASSFDKFQRICAYIQEHFMEYGLSVEKVASDLNVQNIDVRNAVKTLTGKKYTDYVTSLRIEYSKKLLSEQKMSVADICEAVGYSSVSYFIRIFKEETGITPAKFMKEKSAHPNAKSANEAP